MSLVRLGDLRQALAEALKRTDAEQVAVAIENAAGKAGARVSAIVDSSGKVLNIFARLHTGDEEKAETAAVAAADKLGWTLLSKSDKRGVVWWFEPSAGTKGAVPRSKLPAVLWHVTPRENVPGIMQKGLVPSQRPVPGTTRRYAARVYLATDEAGARMGSKSDDTWAMLRVDPAKLPKSTKFYVDQEFGHRKEGTPMAVYTLDPIPPEAIEAA